MEPENDESNKELTTQEAADALGISMRRVRALIGSGRLQANHHETPNKIGYWTIPAANLDAVRDRPTGWKKGRSRAKPAPESTEEK